MIKRIYDLLCLAYEQGLSEGKKNFCKEAGLIEVTPETSPGFRVVMDAFVESMKEYQEEYIKDCLKELR